MGDRGVQQLIEKFLKINKKDKKKVLNFQQEILYKLIKGNNIYTLLSQNTTREQFKSGSAPIFCKLNNVGIPSYWVFSCKDIAEKCAEGYGLVIETEDNKKQPLIMQVDIKSMIN